MVGFEPRSSGVGRNCSAISAKTTTHWFDLIQPSTCRVAQNVFLYLKTTFSTQEQCDQIWQNLAINLFRVYLVSAKFFESTYAKNHGAHYLLGCRM